MLRRITKAFAKMTLKAKIVNVIIDIARNVGRITKPIEMLV